MLTHTYIHTYTNTYMRARVRACVRASVRTYGTHQHIHTWTTEAYLFYKLTTEPKVSGELNICIYRQIVTRPKRRDYQLAFVISWGVAEVQYLKTKVNLALSLELYGIFWWNFVYTLILTRSSPWDFQMLCAISRGFAEVQIVRKWKLPLTLEP